MTHNIIKTHNYLLIVSDEEIKEGDWHMYSNKDGSLNGPYGFRRFLHNDYRCLNAYKCKKLISHLPLNNSPVLEGVPLLPPLEDEVEEIVKDYVQELIDCKSVKEHERAWISAICHQLIIKAKEKYKYTEEDLRKVIDMARETLEYDENRGWYNTKSEDKIIQSLQQPKMPVAFECESTQYTVDEMSKLPLGTVNQKPKTTTNSQGQTVLAGKYIY